MMRILLGVAALGAVVALANPALADWWVVKEASGNCNVVESMEASGPEGHHGEKHLTQADAEAAMAKDPNCKK